MASAPDPIATSHPSPNPRRLKPAPYILSSSTSNSFAVMCSYELLACTLGGSMQGHHDISRTLTHSGKNSCRSGKCAALPQKRPRLEATQASRRGLLERAGVRAGSLPLDGRGLGRG